MCSDLDVGLTASDWSTLRQTVLPTSQEEGEGEEDGGSKSGEETLVVLGDFLSELQSLRRGKGRRGSRGTPEVRNSCTYIPIHSVETFLCFIHFKYLAVLFDLLRANNGHNCSGD